MWSGCKREVTGRAIQGDVGLGRAVVVTAPNLCLIPNPCKSTQMFAGDIASIGLS